MSVPTAPLPQLVAHRGNAAEFPENTLPALRSAWELGVKHLEFDVHLTADHVPVVVHDANLKRTAGLDFNVLDQRWSDLAEVKVAERERFGDRHAGVGLSRLDQIAQAFADLPDVTLFVELKRASLRKFGPDVMMHRVSEALEPVAARAVIISFDLPAVDCVRRNTTLRVGWVLSEYSALSALKAEAIAPEFLFCDHQILPAPPVRLWRGPWSWVIYEVTSAALALQLAAQGVAFVETMRVRELQAELRAAQPSA